MDKTKLIYIVKRLLLMLLTLFVIMTMCFVLIRLLPMNAPEGSNVAQKELIKARWEALGYNKPILVQYGIYLKGIFTEFDFGTSWKIDLLKPANELLTSRLAPTLIINIRSICTVMRLLL